MKRELSEWELTNLLNAYQQTLAGVDALITAFEKPGQSSADLLEIETDTIRVFEALKKAREEIMARRTKVARISRDVETEALVSVLRDLNQRIEYLTNAREKLARGSKAWNQIGVFVDELSTMQEIIQEEARKRIAARRRGGRNSPRDRRKKNRNPGRRRR